jgi:hypothetical protein
VLAHDPMEDGTLGEPIRLVLRDPVRVVPSRVPTWMVTAPVSASYDCMPCWPYSVAKYRLSRARPASLVPRDTSILKSNRIVFDICGTKYRLIAKIDFP